MQDRQGVSLKVIRWPCEPVQENNDQSLADKAIISKEENIGNLDYVYYPM